MDLKDLPQRIKRKEVCALGRFGPTILARRIKLGQMPPPVDRVKGDLFDTAAVLRSLNLGGQQSQSEGFGKVRDEY